MPASEIVPRDRGVGATQETARTAGSRPPNVLVSVQAMRGVAALAIVVLHAMADAGRIAAGRGSGFQHPFYVLAGGVDLFFVISGLVMVWASRDMFGTRGAAVVFIKRRCIRIIPLYWLATTLFLVVLVYYQEVLNSPRPAPGEIVKSYAFIPYRNQLGDLQPVHKLGWTLNYEMFFYTIFCCVLPLTARRAVHVLTMVIGALVLAGLLTGIKWAPVVFWTDPIMLEFVFGAWIGLALIEGWQVRRSVSYILFTFGLLALREASPGVLPRAVIFGIPTAALLMTMVVSGFGAPDFLRPGIILFGDCSYALYLFHPFFLRFFHLAWIKTKTLKALDPWAYVVVASAAAAVSAAAIHLALEKPFAGLVRSKFAGRKRV